MSCLRCDSPDVRVMTESPVGKVWEVYLCENCYYSWRSTENIRILEKFKLDKEKLDKMGIIPPVPPLNK